MPVLHTSQRYKPPILSCILGKFKKKKSNFVFQYKFNVVKFENFPKYFSKLIQNAIFATLYNWNMWK